MSCKTFCLNMFVTNIFSSAVFGENLWYCYNLGVGVVVVVMQNWHFVVSLPLQKIYTWKSDYVFTIKRATYTIKGYYSKCIFCQNYAPFLDLDLFITIKHSTAEHWHLHAVSTHMQCSCQNVQCQNSQNTQGALKHTPYKYLWII